MKKLIAVLALGLASLVAYGHKDRFFTLADDGVIPELPAEYATTRLKIHFEHVTSGRVVGILLTVPGHQTEVQPCILQKIPPSSREKVVLKGSWYHDLSQFPPYVGVRFQASADSSKRSTDEGIELLFSLKDAKLISAQRWATTSGQGGLESTSSPLTCDQTG